jgi:hypothetical protein
MLGEAVLVRPIKAGGVVSLLATKAVVVAVQVMLAGLLVLLLDLAVLVCKVRLLESPHTMLVVAVVLFQVLVLVASVVVGLETSQEPMAGVAAVVHFLRAALAS